MPNKIPQNRGFTLPEVLIVIGILGVIAAFGIPKILNAGNDNSQRNRRTKDAIAMVSAAYTEFLLNENPDANTNAQDLLPYIDYVQEKTTGLIDASPLWADYNCSNPNNLCLELKNGTHILLWGAFNFGGTSDLNATFILVDPDQTYTGNKDSIWFALYYDGKIRTMGTVLPNTADSSGFPYNPNPAEDPSWWEGW